MAEANRWSQAPLALKALLSLTPEHDYPVVSSSHDSEDVHVTAINLGQSRAILAAAQEPLTVVTGPPGTGKSQLVLNIVASAALRGQKVLFASRNNGAVNVVMDRLQRELGYPAAIRTGNRSNRERAVAQIEAALAQVTAEGASPSTFQTKKQYQLAREKARQTQDQLEQLSDSLAY